MEELEYGAPRKRHPRLLIAAVAAFALILTAGWILDRRWQDSATAEVSAATEQAEIALVIAQQRIASMREYVQPAVSRPDLDPDTRQSMNDLVEQAREQGLVELQAARQQLADLTFAPWHDGPRSLRDQALASLEAQISAIDSGESGASLVGDTNAVTG